jgi:STE24 endopeptidase
LLVAAGAGWALSAWLLLDTDVPDGLALPGVNAERTFGAELVQRAEDYDRFLYLNWVASQIVLLVVLLVYARRGARFVRESAAGRIGTGMLLGMLGLALVWLAQLPFGLAAHWWQRRHDVSDESYVAWVFGDWAELGAAFLSVCLALVIVMAVAGKLPRHWWLPGTLVFVAIGAGFQLSLPYLLSIGTDPLRDRALLAAARTYEREQRVDHIPVRVERVSDFTDQVNAYAVGVGPSRRVVLWDTLLRAEYADGEAKVVLAHELGHHSSDHLAEGLGWYALFALPGTYLIARVTRRRGGMARPEAVPLGLLVVTALQLAAAPATNWISRRMEAEADWKALTSTRDPQSARALFRTFAETSLGDPAPPTWAHVLLDSHPTLAQRVAMANAYARERSP